MPLIARNMAHLARNVEDILFEMGWSEQRKEKAMPEARCGGNFRGGKVHL